MDNKKKTKASYKFLKRDFLAMQEILSEIKTLEKNYLTVGLGGLGVTCSPRDPWFAS